MRKQLIVISNVVFLVGCSSTQQAGDPAAVKAEYDSVVAVCKDRYEAENSKYAVARVKCITNANKAYKVLWRSPDIVELMDAERMIAAEKFQSDKMTKSEYVREMARINVQGVGADEARLNANIGAQAQAQQANATSAVAGAMIMNNMQQQNYYNQRLLNQNTQMYRNPTINTSCNTFGNTTNCTTR